EDQSLLIFSNCRPVKAKKAFQFKLFPGADSLVNLSQNDYQGQPEASQETNFRQQVSKWKAELAKGNQKTAENKMTKEEEDQEQDELDQAGEKLTHKDSGTGDTNESNNSDDDLMG
ncbi:conjugal transfer protein, partial [Lentilactobacillus hilgardii]|nr:conjugal transfer protein [Lentilactobacillus hilgardii]